MAVTCRCSSSRRTDWLREAKVLRCAGAVVQHEAKKSQDAAGLDPVWRKNELVSSIGRFVLVAGQRLVCFLLTTPHNCHQSRSVLLTDNVAMGTTLSFAFPLGFPLCILRPGQPSQCANFTTKIQRHFAHLSLLLVLWGALGPHGTSLFRAASCLPTVALPLFTSSYFLRRDFASSSYVGIITGKYRSKPSNQYWSSYIAHPSDAY